MNNIVVSGKFLHGWLIRDMLSSNGDGHISTRFIDKNTY